MKKYILSTACYLIALLAFTGCKKDKDFKEVIVTEVTTLYSPDDGRNLVLQPTGATVYFEWEKSIAQDNGVVYYDVLFDKENGDFSKPIYVVTADNKGISTGASITHKVLNKIGGLAGIASAEEGVLKWTVVASRGLTKTMSKQSRKINITRLSGIDPPVSLYLTGEGTEAGTDLSKALTVKALEGGYEFEIYTKLQAGKTYKFVDSKTSVSRTFSVDAGGATFKENENGATVAKDGVYKINLDFTAGSITFQEITKLDFFMCSPQQRVTLAYQGKGKWKANEVKPVYNGDDRYFFWITIGGAEQKIGSANKDNQAPADLKPSPFYYLVFNATDKNQWDYSFKFPNKTDVSFNITVDLSSELTNYTHLVEKL